MIVKDYHGEKRIYEIRQAKGRPAKDIDYITAAWLQAYKQSPEQDMPGFVAREYYHYTHKKLDQIIPRASAKGSCYMCHENGYPDEFRGFLVAEAFEDFPPVVHWLQVKKAHKRQGVATALLEQFFYDFNLGVPDALVYTFSSSDMKRRKQIRERFEEKGIRLLYMPDMKSTLNEPDWEA